MIASWDVSKSSLFWSQREFKTIMRDDNLEQKLQNTQSQRQ